MINCPSDFVRLQWMAAVACAMLLLSPPLRAVELSEAEKAWETLQVSSRPLVPPSVWKSKQPTEDEMEGFRNHQKEFLHKAADMARDFAARFPDDPNVPRAQRKELELLTTLMRLRDINVATRIEALEPLVLKHPKWDEEDRLEIRREVLLSRMALVPPTRDAQIAVYEQAARQLMKEFPNQPDGYEMLMNIAQQADPENGRKMAEEIARSPGAGNIAKDAVTYLNKINAVGKTLDLKFTALDGREINLNQMKGKVVLVDFWATWCGPCVKEIPNVLAAYEKLQPQGFEILGISFDQKKEALVAFVADKKMTWPQYFDGLGWENPLGKKFNISAIPAMWLVDKKGVLRDLNARENLAEKVKKLLEEN